jgi:hypothetical protein
LSGKIIETFVYNQLIAQIELGEEQETSLYHYREWGGISYEIKKNFNLFVKRAFYQLELTLIEMLLTEQRQAILDFRIYLPIVKELLKTSKIYV